MAVVVAKKRNIFFGHAKPIVKFFVGTGHNFRIFYTLHVSSSGFHGRDTVHAEFMYCSGRILHCGLHTNTWYNCDCIFYLTFDAKAVFDSILYMKAYVFGLIIIM